MPLESAQFVHELNPQNPASTDLVDQGDDHLRVIKNALRNTLPNLSGAITLTQGQINGLPALVDTKAPLVSPALTGTPTAPTAAQGTRTDQLATTEFVFNNAVPQGGIIMWSGSTVPQGWRLCDGSNGTPDLRNRFVMGGALNQSGTTGGATTASASTTAAGSHSHGGVTHNHTLTIEQMPSHRHLDGGHSEFGTGSSISASKRNTGLDWPARRFYTDSQGGGQAHSHGLSADGNHSHSVTVNTVPPYYQLAFIMKV